MDCRQQRNYKYNSVGNTGDLTEKGSSSLPILSGSLTEDFETLSAKPRERSLGDGDDIIGDKINDSGQCGGTPIF